MSCPLPWLSGHRVILGGSWHAQLRLTKRLAHSACTDVPFQYGEGEAERYWNDCEKADCRSLHCFPYCTKVGRLGIQECLWSSQKLSLYALECDMLATLAVGTDLRFSPGHTVIFMGLENVCAFKSPQASTSEHSWGRVGNLWCYRLLDFSVWGTRLTQVTHSLEVIRDLITFCNKRISVLW